MSNYIYTYGLEGHPYKGGWTSVWAENRHQADTLFSIVHPNKNGFLNCAFVYNIEQFNNTKMPKEGNFGKYCWEVIELTITKRTDEE